MAPGIVRVMVRRAGLNARELALARRIARSAVLEAAALLRRSTRPAPRRAIRKGPGDFVTAVDLRLERHLRSVLLEALPDAGFLGEETEAAALGNDLVWVVDPIDGTSNFAAGLPHHAIAVALLQHRRPVVAACWCEPAGELFEAVRGGGAFRAGRRLRIADGRWDDGAILGVQWHRGQQQLGFLADLQRDGARIRTFGCTVTQLLDVVCGRLDGNVQQQGRIWDIAAAGLVVEESGGRFTDWSGRPVFPLPSLDIGHLPTVAASRRVLPGILRRLQGHLLVPPP